MQQIIRKVVIDGAKKQDRDLIIGPGSVHCPKYTWSTNRFDEAFSCYMEYWIFQTTQPDCRAVAWPATAKSQ